MEEGEEGGRGDRYLRSQPQVRGTHVKDKGSPGGSPGGTNHENQSIGP